MHKKQEVPKQDPKTGVTLLHYPLPQYSQSNNQSELSVFSEETIKTSTIVQQVSGLTAPRPDTWTNFMEDSFSTD